MLGDIYFDSVVLLLHLDNTSYTDSSSYAHTATPIQVSVDTSIKKFGAGSAFFIFGGSVLNIPDAPELDLSTGDWTIEAQARFDSAFIGNDPCPIIHKNNGASSTAPFDIHLNATGNLIATGQDSIGNPAYSLDGGVIPFDTFVYVELDRRGDTFTLRVNGVTVDTATFAGTLHSNAQPIQVGGRSVISQPLRGWVDDVRITKGISRYTVDPPTQTAAWPDFRLIPASTRPKWVQFGRAIRLPHVLGGRGRFQHEKEALQAFIVEARTNQIFAKRIANASHGTSNIRVDVNHPNVSAQPVDATTFTDTVQ